MLEPGHALHLVMVQSQSLGWSCVWWKCILSPKPHVHTGEALQTTASFLAPTCLLASAWQTPMEDVEDFGMEGKPWQWKRAGLQGKACLSYMLAYPSREMLTDGGTPLWRLNQLLHSWLPCEHGRC